MPMTDQPRSHGPGHRPGDHGAGEGARMPDHPRYQGTDEDAAGNAAREPPTARQRRVRLLVIAIVIAIVLAILLMHVTGAMPKGTGF
jgi:hypothetical protein